jgi:hypothetical protein
VLQPTTIPGASRIYPYRPNIISDEDIELFEIIRKDKMPDENLEETEDGNSYVGAPLRLEGLGLPTSPSPRTPDNIDTTRKYCSH